MASVGPSITLAHADCLEWMKNIPDETVDSVVCDPPYNLSFMGKGWDSHDTPVDFQNWCTKWGKEALRVLKPGGHLVAYGGTRTYHRLTCGLEDAGFEIRDSFLYWGYGSGFPKSHNVSLSIDKMHGHGNRGRAIPTASTYQASDTEEKNKLTSNPVMDYEAKTNEGKRWAGFGTALKPAYEPIVLARKPLKRTVASNVTCYGTGALNIDGCRIAGDNPSVDRRQHAAPAKSVGATGWVTTARPPSYNDDREGELLGRWPSNVLTSHVTECVYLGTSMVAGREIRRPTEKMLPFGGGAGMDYEVVHFPDEEVENWDCAPGCPVGELGDVSRFYYCAKVSVSERNAGCEERNFHPTVKPIDLMRWLCRLVTPPGGLILDPFMGSGSTGIAALLEGFNFIGIEQNLEYLKLASARLDFWQQHGEDGLRIVADRDKKLRESQQQRQALEEMGQMDLFEVL